MQMVKLRQTASTRLYNIALQQQGFFSTKQAEAAGFRRQTHYYHTKTGHWLREHRGIYRLSQFPSPDRPDLVRWFLWSRNREEIPQGVYSHETALTLHDLSDAMPAKLHMTVPRSFRRSGPIPRALVLHRNEIPRSDVEMINHVKVTRPLRTIVDLLQDGRISDDTLVQALREGLRRGLITQRAVRQTSLPDALQKEFKKLLVRAA